MTVTQDSYFIGVVQKGGGDVPTDERTYQVLASAGCLEIEHFGSGTAQARIPEAWARSIEKNGGWCGECVCYGVTYVIDCDLP